jgi:glycyl-tRNA synthetase beta chain
MNKTMQDTLLVELFTEELPPKALAALSIAFATTLGTELSQRGHIHSKSTLNSFASPRRLGLMMTNVLAIAPDEPYSEKLMPVSVGLDKDGKATPALIKKLASKSLEHIDVSNLERESDGKTEQLIYRGVARGLTLQEGLQASLEEAIKKLPVPKVMSYQLADGATTVQFVRPVHALVALHGANVVPVTVLGLTAGRTTHGHRFQGATNIELKHADEYETRLEAEGGVTPRFDKRKADIESQLREAAEQHGANLGPVDDYAALLDEVTALVEHPTVYVGAFDTEFLAVPAECLILTMKLNQKYFPLFDRSGKLTNQFLIVSNLRLDNPHNIVEGNQRVVRPRLSDARFFFETDKKTTLEARLPKLANVVYHNKLGNQFERMQRVSSLACSIGGAIGGEKIALDSLKAAQLAKADLLTEMVGEFPELQGIMGRYYALNDGVGHDIAVAIEDHYKPRFASDALPRNQIGTAVALADKTETLVGMFCIGNLPTGDKDPYALRRHALGVIRMLTESAPALELDAVILGAFQFFDVNEQQKLSICSLLLEFIYERFAGVLREQGYNALEVDAVLSLRPKRLADVGARLAAVREFMALPEAESLAAANKRIGNILKRSEAANTTITESLLVEPAERALFDALKVSAPKFDAAFHAQNYTAALKSLAVLKTPVDAFFDGVMVNAEDAKLRNNRLALLNDLHRLMNKVADLSKLAA